jgi:uncharacterized protein YcfL
MYSLKFIKLIVTSLILILIGCSGHQPSAEWNPGVILGEKTFQKNIWTDVIENRFIHDIKTEKSISQDSSETAVVITSSGQAFWTDIKGKLKKTINFNFEGKLIVFFNFFPTSKILFLNRGGGWQPVSVYDRTGQCLWSYGNNEKDETPENMAGGDINGDGKPEFVVGSDNITCFNSVGRVLWKQPGKGIWHVEVIDLNGDGKGEIVHSNSDGFMVVRNDRGDIFKTIRLPFYFGHFSLINCPTAKGNKDYIIASAEGKIYIIEPLEGKKVASFNAPMAPENSVQGVFVHFENNKKPYLAVVVKVKPTWQRSILFIYSSEGNLIYQEILATYYPALSPLLKDKKSVESLLVGGPGVIWEYKLREQKD